MKKFILFCSFIILFSHNSLFSSEFYKKNIHFHVYRNGDKIGFHKIDFFLKEDISGYKFIEARININFNVKFLGFTIYDYTHENIEKWRILEDEQISSKCINCNHLNVLETLDSSTDKNGTNMFCNIKKNQSSYFVNGSSNEDFTISDFSIIPSSYWYSHLVTRQKVKSKFKINKEVKVLRKDIFNSQDCSLINFKIENKGKDLIYENLISYRYKLTGKESNGEDLDINIWYDINGNWVKMIFIKDDSEIEYFLDDYHDIK